MKEDLNNSFQSTLLMLQQKLSVLEEILLSNQSVGDWIDEETAKRLTGLGKSTLYKLRKEGKITSSRLSKRKVFYRLSDLSRLLDENETA